MRPSILTSRAATAANAHRHALLAWWPFSLVCLLALAAALWEPSSLVVALAAGAVCAAALGTVSVSAAAAAAHRERHALSLRTLLPPEALDCSFCSRSAADAGPFVEAADGARVCGNCAASASAVINGRKSVAQKGRAA